MSRDTSSFIQGRTITGAIPTPMSPWRYTAH